MRLPALILFLLLPIATQAQQVAITFDDLPVHSQLPAGMTRLEVANKIIAALKAGGVPPTYGFVNAIHLSREPETIKVLEAWRAAGNPLGNHSYSHHNLNTTPETDWEADVLKNEATLQPLMSGPADDYHWLRFPFLGEGDTPEKRTGVRAFLLAHHYRIAGVTMSFADYNYSPPFARCLAKNDTATIKQLEDTYLAAADYELTRSLALSRALYHRDIPLVLLMHIGAFDSTMIPRLLALYKSRGVTFITLEQAESDKFYKFDTDLSLPPGPDSLEALASSVSFPKSTPPTLDFDKLCH